jgi:hypothetical protein
MPEWVVGWLPPAAITQDRSRKEHDDHGRLHIPNTTPIITELRDYGIIIEYTPCIWNATFCQPHRRTKLIAVTKEIVIFSSSFLYEFLN